MQSVAGGRFNVELHTYGAGAPLIYLHGAAGLLGIETFLEDLGRYFTVLAPHFPGFGESSDSEAIDDVIDGALFYHALMDSLGIDSAYLLGHSMGGMLAAEVAALDSRRAKKLVLAAPAGFWLDEAPIADLFVAQLHELPALLFHDPKSQIAQAVTFVPDDLQALGVMYLERTRRFTMASRFLWPLPERGLKKRIYRITAPTLLLWGQSDRVIPPVYAGEFTKYLSNSHSLTIAEAGHMLMYEQPDRFCQAVRDFCLS